MRTRIMATIALASLTATGTCQPAAAQYYETRPVLSGAYTPVEAVYNRSRPQRTSNAPAASRAASATQDRARQSADVRYRSTGNSVARQAGRRTSSTAHAVTSTQYRREARPVRQTAYAPLSTSAAAPQVQSGIYREQELQPVEQIEGFGAGGALPLPADSTPYVASTDGTSVASCGTNGCGSKAWYFRAEALWLERDQTDQFLGNEQTVAPAVVSVFSTEDITFDREVGPRATLGFWLDESTGLELSYFGLQSWNESASTTITAGNQLFSPFLASNAAADTYNAFYESDLHSAELNARRYIGAGFSVLGGLRYLNVNENFDFHSVDDGTAVQLESTLASASNNMLGVQVGSAYCGRIGIVGLQAQGAVGLLINCADQKMTNVTTPLTTPVVNLTTGGDQTTTTAMFELGLMGTLQVHRNLCFRGGYQLLYLSGLALAPEQLALLNNDIVNGTISGSTGQGLSDRGNVLYHGPSFGAELTWGGGR